MHHFNCYDLPEEETWKCDHCDAGLAYTHAVDQTNDEGRPKRFKIKTEAVMCQCNSCGNEHAASPATYVVPDVSPNFHGFMNALEQEVIDAEKKIIGH